MNQPPVDRHMASTLSFRDQEASDDQQTRALSRQYGVRDATFQAEEQGGGENYFSAYALLLHASPFQISILCNRESNHAGF